MEIPLNNSPELAQWYLERGFDQKTSGLWFTAVFLVVPICWILVPFSIWHYIEGRRKVKLGKAMNKAANRENYTPPRGIPTNNFQRGMNGGPGARYFPVSDEPPVEPIWA